jgi:hypothetical protein
LQFAAEVLAEGREVVVLDDALALRPASDRILCEVISSGSAAHQTQVESAKQLLHAFTLGSFVDSQRCRWFVVEDYGTGTMELWRES